MPWSSVEIDMVDQNYKEKNNNRDRKKRLGLNKKKATSRSFSPLGQKISSLCCQKRFFSF